jgi:hypothetical protein
LIDEVSRDIAGTVDDGLYQSERWADTPFTYEIPLPDGTFNVSLYFAELYSKAQAPNKRVFDVTIEGVTLLDDLDIFQEVGGNTSMIRDFPVDVSDGALTVDFIPGALRTLSCCLLHLYSDTNIFIFLLFHLRFRLSRSFPSEKSRYTKLMPYQVVRILQRTPTTMVKRLFQSMDGSRILMDQVLVSFCGTGR